MKPYILSLAMGLCVGMLYAWTRIKSPAPPVIALLGLLGMVCGEQLGSWLQLRLGALLR